MNVKKIHISLLIGLLLLTVLLSAGMGAFFISPIKIIGIFLDKIGMSSGIEFTEQEAIILFNIRLPRIAMGLLTGGGLAIAGVALQGLLRNPLAAPSLLGVSAGSTFAAALFLVILAPLISLNAGLGWLGSYGLAFSAFLGAALTGMLVYRIAQSPGKTSVSTLLLTGVALQALAMAFTGLLIYLSDDAQLRSLTFWTLGSLGGSSWLDVGILFPFVLIPALILPFKGHLLNALALGEDAAYSLGFRVERNKKIIFLLATLAVGATVAFTGTIGFIGLIVPHLVRSWIGPDHKNLIIYSALVGASLLTGADSICRTVVAPTELPIGILTALLGTPFFLWLLIRDKRKLSVL